MESPPLHSNGLSSGSNYRAEPYGFSANGVFELVVAGQTLPAQHDRVLVAPVRVGGHGGFEQQLHVVELGDRFFADEEASLDNGTASAGGDVGILHDDEVGVGWHGLFQ